MKKIVTVISTILFIATLGLQADKNANCPISGKAVNPEVSLNINGKEVGFCCNNCPKAYEKKLNVTDVGSEKAKCAISGKEVAASTRILHAKSEVTYFCCAKCEAKFIKKNKLTVSNKGPKTCPISGKAATKEFSLVHNGESVYFCCEKCSKGFLKKIQAVETAKTCPISGEPADGEQKISSQQPRRSISVVRNVRANIPKNILPRSPDFLFLHSSVL